jgi:hypothetical protein
MRSAKAHVPDSAGGRLAMEVFPRIDDMIMGAQTITLRVAE